MTPSDLLLPAEHKAFMLGTEAALLDFLMIFLRNAVNNDFGGGGGGGGGGISGFRVTSVCNVYIH